MKVSVFTSAESYADWNRRQAEAIRNNGLRLNKEQYDRELHDEDTKMKWLSMNGLIEGHTKEEMNVIWENHLDWRRKYIKSLERKIRKLERDADKALANA